MYAYNIFIYIYVYIYIYIHIYMYTRGASVEWQRHALRQWQRIQGVAATGRDKDRPSKRKRQRQRAKDRMWTSVDWKFGCYTNTDLSLCLSISFSFSFSVSLSFSYSENSKCMAQLLASSCCGVLQLLQSPRVVSYCNYYRVAIHVAIQVMSYCVAIGIGLQFPPVLMCGNERNPRVLLCCNYCNLVVSCSVAITIVFQSVMCRNSLL